jgi:hypothetical protein
MIQQSLLDFGLIAVVFIIVQPLAFFLVYVELLVLAVSQKKKKQSSLTFVWRGRVETRPFYISCGLP